jgi:hypothetical protein
MKGEKDGEEEKKKKKMRKKLTLGGSQVAVFRLLRDAPVFETS